MNTTSDVGMLAQKTFWTGLGVGGGGSYSYSVLVVLRWLVVWRVSGDAAILNFQICEISLADSV